MKEKFRKELVLKTDQESNERYWVQEMVSVIKPEESDRINAVLDILKGATTAEDVRKKYSIRSINSIYTWIGKFVIQEKALSFGKESEEEMSKKSKDDQIRELKAQLKQARKESGLEKLRGETHAASLKSLCGLFGYSRQSFYNRTEDRGFAEKAIESLIVEKAKDYRKDNPGLGCAKLYLIIRRLFESTGGMPDRDAFIEILRANGLMVQIKRRRHYRTTDSSHHYRKYENLVKGLVPMRPNKVLVSDITYIETEECVCYLSLITDMYSRKIVGWAIGPTLDRCREEVNRIIRFYNTERPHMSIGNKTPEVVHGETDSQKRCWRNPWERTAEAAAPE